jgi:hypothetical protein
MLYREKYAFGGLRINREYPDPAQICDMLQIYPGIDGVPGAYTLPIYGIRNNYSDGRQLKFPPVDN